MDSEILSVIFILLTFLFLILSEIRPITKFIDWFNNRYRVRPYYRGPIVRPAPADQTTPLQQWTNSNGDVLVSIDPHGNVIKGEDHDPGN